MLNAAKQLYDGENSDTYKPKRKRVLNRNLDDYVVTERVNIESNEDTDDYNSLKSFYFEVIDVILYEIDTRFQSNTELIQTIGSVNDFDPKKLSHLSVYGIEVLSINELQVVKNYLNVQDENINIFEEIYKQNTAFKATYKMLAAVQVFACSMAVNESSFSTLTRLDEPSRRSMSHQRLSLHFIFILFEYK